MAYLALPLILLTPFIYFLSFHSYRFAQTESLLILTGLTLLGLLLALWYRKGGTITQLLLLTITSTIAASFLPTLQTIGLLLVLTLVLLVLFMWLQQEFLTIFTLVLGVFIGGIISLPMKKQLAIPTLEETAIKTAPTNLPIIIHVILDEHIGAESAAVTAPQGQQLQQQLQQFYQQHGFRLFGNAYSHYLHTYNAIANLLNFSAYAQDNYYFIGQDEHERSLKQNAYFNQLAQLGYQIRVYQSDYLDYCHTPGLAVAACYTYPAASIKGLETTPFAPQDKALFLLKSFLLSSSLYNLLQFQYQFALKPWLEHLTGWQLPHWQWYQARTAGLPVPAVFAKLRHDIVTHPRGTVFFAHLLIPHNPYIYDKNCRYLAYPPAEWQIDVGPLPLVNSVATHTYRYQLYQQQISCVNQQLAQLFTTLKQANLYYQAKIIIHGDHSSRIMYTLPTPQTQNSLTQQDLADTYQTLFAIKTPTLSPSYDRRWFALEELLPLLTQVKIDLPKPTPYIYLVAETKGKPMEKRFLFEH